MIPSCSYLKHVNFDVVEVTKDTFCSEVKDATSYIGHEATAKLVSQLCNVEVAVNRSELKLSDLDMLVVIQVAVRLPEGKVLSIDELNQLLSEKKIRFFKVYYDDLTDF